jgi:beta-lactamase regulating signal transducer with metallopeptidase domain
MTEFFPTVESADLLDFVTRSTILLVVSLVLQWLFRRWSATPRHHLWTLTFVILLALPAFRQLGPSWTWRLSLNADRPTDAVLRVEVAGASEFAGSGAISRRASALVADPSAGEGEREGPASRPWTGLALTFWAAGFGVAFVSLGVGVLRFSRLVHTGRPVEDEAWLHQLDSLRRRLSTQANVRLVLVEEALTPMTGGVFRPVVLLPASATDWSEARRHAVLAHELVHVRRRDALRQLLGRLVLAVYWFHPLSWFASHSSTLRREEACDEAVLALGARPSEYAGHLLSLAGGGLRRPAFALPMAQQSQLERRIRVILSPGRPRPNAVVAAVALVVAGIGGVSVSIADPVRAESAPGVVGDVDRVDPASLHCVPASEADELSGWEFGEELGELLVCRVQGETVAIGSHGVHTNELAGWAGLEREIRRQLRQRSASPP